LKDQTFIPPLTIINCCFSDVRKAAIDDRQRWNKSLSRLHNKPAIALMYAPFRLSHLKSASHCRRYHYGLEMHAKSTVNIGERHNPY